MINQAYLRDQTLKKAYHLDRIVSILIPVVRTMAQHYHSDCCDTSATD